MTDKFLFLILITITFSRVYSQNNCSYAKGPTEAIQKLAKLAKDNTFLRIIVYKYEFRPFQKWPEKQDLMTPNDRIKEHKEGSKSGSKKFQKTKVLEFFKIVFRVDNYDGMFNREEMIYVFKDKHQNKKIKKLIHVHSQEEKSSLEIKSKEMDLNIEFYMGPKMKKIKQVHEYYYSNHAKDRKKEAVLIHPDLEMGYGEPLTYHIFVYFKKNASGGQEPNIEADNDVNKALKEIIKSSEPKPADGSFNWERKEKVISNVRDSLCDFLKPWIEPTNSKTVKVDFYSAVQYVLQHPGIFSQKSHEGDTFRFGHNNIDFSPQKFQPRVDSKSGDLMRKIFDKSLSELRKNIKEDIDKDGESDDLNFLNKINQLFKKTMNENFKLYRDQKGIQGKYVDKDLHLDAIIHQVQRTAKETDANDAVFKTYHVDG